MRALTGTSSERGLTLQSALVSGYKPHMENFRGPCDERNRPTHYRLSDLVESLLIEHDEARRAHSEGKAMGPITGFKPLDTALGGQFHVGLNVLQAAPGAGKTAFSLQVGAQCGFGTVYTTTEMPAKELFRRIIARETRTPLGTVGSLEMNRDRLKSLATEVATRLAKFIILDGSVNSATCKFIRDSVLNLRSDVGSGPILIVIDSLQYWARSTGLVGYISEYDAIAKGIRDLAELANELDCVVLLISHRNRSGQQQGGLHASKGSGDIEYAAECVLELDTPSDAKPNAANEKYVTLRILKNRHGAAGTQFKLRFSGPLQSFRF
jgi:replicative DNA helicase